MPTIDVNGETLHYIKEGSGPVVVFVHYLGGHSRTWQRQISALRDRFTCIAFDQRGYGFSSFNGRWSAKTSAEDLKAGLDALGVEAAHFAGFSTGGPVMYEFNACWPEMIRSLMLIDTFAKNHKHSAERIAESEKCLGYMSMRQYARQYAAARLMTDVPEEMVDDLIAGICLSRKDAYLDTIRGILEPDFTELCRRIEAPTLVLCGSLDVTTPVDYTNDLTDLIPNAREIVIEAAHLGIWENPKAFDAAVYDWLDGQEASG